ncbi:MAG: hypothetical protein IH993_00395 [Proteobacteria bacterium]|nr:hypothetical protein [Pseudomonadota bacterium]
MTITAYCRKQPGRSQLDADRAKLNLSEEIDVEEFLQQWGEGTIDPQHVYADDGLRYQILARKLAVSPCIMVAFYDKNDDKITLTAVRDKPHQAALNTAYLFSNKTRNDLPQTQGWTP